MPLILEGLVTTRDLAGKVNLAPMGPLVDRDLTQFTLRPFRTAQTYSNLREWPEGVFHVTDDVELLARAALGMVETLPALVPAVQVDVPMLSDTCRWFEFRVEEFDDVAERTTLHCQIIHRGEGRPFFGFNRAKHAVLEAAILATRIGILSADEIQREMASLAMMVNKTAGDQEAAAFALLQQEICRRIASVAEQS